MPTALKYILAFVAGAGVGVGAMTIVSRKKIKELEDSSQADMDEMREYYKEKYSHKSNDSEKTEVVEDNKPVAKEEPVKMASKYHAASNIPVDAKPATHPITIEEWEEDEDHSREYGLVYYEEDGVLQDSLGNNLLIEDTVGEAALTDDAFDDDDMSYAMNEALGIIYEIQRVHNASYNQFDSFDSFDDDDE